MAAELNIEFFKNNIKTLPERGYGSKAFLASTGKYYTQTQRPSGKLWTEDTSGGGELPYDLYVHKLEGQRVVIQAFQSFTIGNEYIIGSVAAGGTGILSSAGSLFNPFTSIGEPFVIGETYILSLDPSLFGDDFFNIGYVSPGIPFVATGTTPTQWTTFPVTLIFQQTNAIPDDFTNIGFVALDVPFIATGTTAAQTGGNTLVIDLTESYTSNIVLEDTIGGITIEDNDFIPGFYVEIKSAGKFIKDKTWLNAASSGYSYQISVQNMQWIDENTIRVSIARIPDPSVVDYDYDYEIRIYK